MSPPPGPTHRVEGEEGGPQGRTDDVDEGFEGGGGSRAPHGQHRFADRPHAQLQRQRTGQDPGELRGAGGAQDEGVLLWLEVLGIKAHKGGG